MSKVLIDDRYLTDIADSIRKKRGTHDLITTDSMAAEIMEAEIASNPDEKWERPIDWPDYDSLNLFKNKLGKSIATEGGHINQSGGITSVSNWYYTTYIDVKPNTSYVASSISKGGSNTYYALYDKNKTLTRTVLIVANENPAFTTASNEYYVRFSIRNLQNELATAQLEEGTVATEYSPFFEGMYFTYDTSQADHYDEWVGIYCACSGGYKVERGQIVNGVFQVQATTNKSSGAVFEEWIESTVTGYVVYRVTAATAGQPITSIGLRDMSATLRTDGRASRNHGHQPILERYGRLPNITSFSNWRSYHVVSDTILDLKKLTSLYNVWVNSYCIENIDITGYDSQVGNCSQTFYNCQRLRYLNCTDKFITSNCTTMYYMFSYCYLLPFLDSGGWNTSNVTRMDATFAGCYSLYKLDVSHWNVSKVTIMASIFSGCTNLLELDISGWTNSLLTSFASMFTSCYNVKRLDISGLSSTNITTTSSMFNGCYSIKEIIGIEDLNTSKVTNMSAMFNNCRAIEHLDVSNFDTSKVTNFSTMFQYTVNLRELDLSNFDFSAATTINSFLYGSSARAKSIHLPSNISSTAMSGSSIDYSFGNIIAVHELDLTGFNFSSITAPNYVCRYDYSLEKCVLPASLKYIAQYFFGDCTNLKTVVLPSTTLVTLTNTNAFSGATRAKTIYVPDNLVASYRTANNWKSLTNVTFAGLSTYTG